MHPIRLAAGLALVLAAGSAFAQAPAPRGTVMVDGQSVPINRLPEPAVDPNAPPAAFIEAARQALAIGNVGEAQEAIERAESRALDRSVKPSLANQPSQQSLVSQLSDARAALAGGDRLRATQILAQALANPEAGAK